MSPTRGGGPRGRPRSAPGPPRGSSPGSPRSARRAGPRWAASRRPRTRPRGSDASAPAGRRPRGAVGPGSPPPSSSVGASLGHGGHHREPPPVAPRSALANLDGRPLGEGEQDDQRDDPADREAD